MSEGPSCGLSEQGLTLQSQVREVVHRFIDGLQADTSPRIEAFLEGHQEPLRSLVLRELLVTEWEHRFPENAPDPAEYYDRFPKDRSVIDSACEQITQHREQTLATAEHTEPKDIGAVVGRYKLLQEIGEGGMGTVYMAQQEEPVRRKVALKIIKPGMDTREVIARFEAEQQALAMMEHQNIAKVLDAGATENGRPFFVMELVRGVPITKYCDDNRLNIAERLELFLLVCHAVQHAHQKGIIHRDIKPSNVLVCNYDDKPVPKVIDFGIAKAIQQQLTEKTLFTQFGQVVGTPEYMSPEQAQMNELDVDTRSDVYSLGVLLYELLTGETPITSGQLRAAGLEGMLQLIREQEPPKPSARISTTVEASPSISIQRRSDGKKLGVLVRGDLDWIVMKALNKDRARRYDTASSFARDIERHVANEPVEACPPTAAYKMRKFVCKHRAGINVAAALAAILILGAGVSTWLATELAQKNRRLEVTQGELAESLGKLTRTLRDAYYDLGYFDKAITELSSVYEVARIYLGESHPVTLDVMHDLAMAYSQAGRYQEALPLHDKAVTLTSESLESNHPSTLRAAGGLATTYVYAGQYDEAIALCEATLERMDAHQSPHSQNRDTLLSLRADLAAARWRPPA